MNIYLNGLALNDLNGAIHLDEPIEGLDLAPIRLSGGDYSGRSGGYSGTPLYGRRPVTIPGHIFSNDVAAMDAARQALGQAVDVIAHPDITLRIVTNAGAIYLLYAKLYDFSMPVTRYVSKASFKIDLICGDPILYDDTAGIGNTVALTRIASGGSTWPRTWPLTYTGGAGPTSVVNGGAIEIAPTITLTGSMTNPTLTNLTNGGVLQISPLVTSPGDVVVIDMRQFTITLNGQDIYALKNTSTDFWTLEVGGNNVKLETASSADTVTGVIGWRNGYASL